MTTNEIIRELCRKNNITIQRLEQVLGFSNASIAKATSNMKAEKLKAIADYFGVTMEYLMTGEEPEQASSEGNKYYFDEDAAQLAEFLHKNPEYKALFDASRKVKPEDIEFVLLMILKPSYILYRQILSPTLYHSTGIIRLS